MANEILSDPTDLPTHLYEILGRFTDAGAFIECGIQALERSDDAGPEAVVLQHGFDMLNEARGELDQAIRTLKAQAGAQ